MISLRAISALIAGLLAVLAAACGGSEHTGVKVSQRGDAVDIETEGVSHVEIGIGGKFSAGLESPLVLKTAEAAPYLSVVIQMPEAVVEAPPTSVGLALVLDRSGSMNEDQKIENARFAGSSIIEALGRGDEISLTTFENTANVVAPRTAIDDQVKLKLQEEVSRLVADGTTALYSGLVNGINTLAGSTLASKRVILISDGLANVGPDTAEDIIAGLPDIEESLTLSTIGVGTDYDEKILTAVARRGNGRFYHLTDPVELAGRMKNELGQAREIAATDAVFDIKVSPGVEVLGAEGLKIQQLPEGITRVHVGNLYSGESRSVSVQVKVPTSGQGRQLLGTVKLEYHPITGKPSSAPSELKVYYSLTDSPDAVAAEAVPPFMVAADRQRVVHVLKDAAAMIEEGDLLEAQAILRDEEARLKTRLGRLEGTEKRDLQRLLDLFDDSYVSTDFSAAPAPEVAPDRFDQLVEIARRGEFLPRADLAGLDQAQLRILRNVSYARHGYPFKTADMSGHFGNTSWYKRNPGFSQKMLTKADMANIKLVRSFEGTASLKASTKMAAPPPSAAGKPSGKDFDALLETVVAGEKVSSADVFALDLKQLRILRNACFARHGRKFRSKDLREYFGKLSWYKVDPGFKNSRLTAVDQQNISTLRAREQQLIGGAGKGAMREFLLRNKARVFEVLQQ